MAVSLVASVARTNVLLVVTGWAAGDDRVRIVRVDAGDRATVRMGNDVALPVDSATLIAFDYEAPQGRPVWYEAVTWSSGSGFPASPVWVSSGTVSPDFGGDFLFDLASPVQGLAACVTGVPAVEQDSAAQVAWISGRTDPVVIAQPMRLPSGTLSFFVADYAALAALRAAIATSPYVALSARMPDHLGLDGVQHYAVLKAKATHTAPQNAERETGWVVEWQVQAIATPPAQTISLRQRAWGDLESDGTAYWASDDDVNAPTWAEAIYW